VDSKNSRAWLGKALGVLGPFAVLLALIVVLRIAVGESYFSAYNLRAVPLQATIVAISAIGMTMIIVAGGIDLSVGSVIALCGVSAALVLRSDPNASALAIVAALVTGVVAGLVNGAIIAYGRMAPFIVTLGMMGVARGLAKWAGDKQTVDYDSSAWLNELMRTTPDPRWMVVAPGVWLMVILTVLMILFMRHAVFARRLYAIGSNEATAQLCGIRVPSTKLLMYGLAGLFFGLSGALQTARLTQGDPTAAVGLELDVIAAVVIGGASLSGGAGSVLGAVVGALIMTVLRNGTQQLGWESYTQEIIIGLVIVIAVALDRLRQSGLLSWERLSRLVRSQ
jgi:ribose transport system permease protein